MLTSGFSGVSIASPNYLVGRLVSNRGTAVAASIEYFGKNQCPGR